jgi:MscS family membrane protein
MRWLLLGVGQAAEAAVEQAVERGFFEQEFLGNALWRWIAYAVIVLAAILLSKTVAYVFSVVIKAFTRRTRVKIDDLLVSIIQKPITLALLVSGLYFGLYLLAYDGRPLAWWVDNLYAAFVTILVVYVLARLYGDLMNHYLRPLVERTDSKLDDHLLPLAIKGGRFVIWAVGLVMALDELGLQVTSLIAGLGIGGLALAMAAKDTIANVFGGASIFADKPFELGDVVDIGGKTGKVEEIGVRTTRIRTFEDTLFVIPNSKVADGAVENHSVRRRRRHLVDLGLTYDTTWEKLQEAKAIVARLLSEDELVDDDFVVRFDGFGDFALLLKVIYWVKDPDKFFEKMPEINEQILREFGRAGIAFAFPTQTVHLVKSD